VFPNHWMTELRCTFDTACFGFIGSVHFPENASWLDDLIGVSGKVHRSHSGFNFRQDRSGLQRRMEDVPHLSAIELLGFPEGRHDDQVDSISQALAWIEKRKQNHVPLVWPIIVRVRNPYREAFPDFNDIPR
jgi:hypothetical protein